LDIADYGILLREKSITNKVASPVKCAKYLSRGLKVLISPEIGDYSDWVKNNDLGFIIEIESQLPQLIKENRKPMVLFASEKLNKQTGSIQKKYLSVIKG
jgi:hypothetical protein